MRAPRLERKIIPEPTSGCWLWGAYIDELGYGRYRTSRPRLWARAHRVVYEALVGPIPPGLHIDHRCRNTACVNPDHLEPVTCKENVRRGLVRLRAGIRNREKTHCPRGHPLAGSNLAKEKYGRKCRTCKNIRQRVAWKRGSRDVD